jgi:peptidoglycan/LPS O-acetylase OafA/YrhL
MRSIGLRANPLLFDPLFYPHLNTMANSVPVRPADYAFGLVWTMVFMGLLLLARRIAINPATTFVRTVRFISEGTFPIYLTHFPLYVLIAACVPYNHANPLPKIIIYICVYSRNTRRTPRQYSEK